MANFQYVNKSGGMGSVEAADSAAALSAIKLLPDADPTSGVMGGSPTLSGVQDKLNTMSGPTLKTDSNGNVIYNNTGKAVALDANGNIDYSKSESLNLASSGGVVSSSNATQALGSSVNGGGNDIYSRLASVQAELAKEKEKSGQLETGLSLSEQQRIKSGQDAIITANGTKKADAATNTVQLYGLDLTPDEVNDPVIKELVRNSQTQENLISTLFNQTLSYGEKMDEYSKQEISDIVESSQLQKAAVQKENARVLQSAQSIGAMTGRALYAPLEDESIISSTIQEGLAKLREIDLTERQAVRLVNKSRDEFNFKMVGEANKLISDLSTLRTQTVSDIHKTVLDNEKRLQDSITNRQAQEDRNALILAPTLVGKKQDEIAKVAAANNIPLGSLLRTVDEYRMKAETHAKSMRPATTTGDEKDSQGFTTKDNALFRQAGLGTASYDEKVRFLNLTPTEQEKRISANAEKSGKNSSVDDVIAEISADKNKVSRLKSLADEKGLSSVWTEQSADVKRFLNNIVNEYKKDPSISDDDLKSYLLSF